MQASWRNKAVHSLQCTRPAFRKGIKPGENSHQDLVKVLFIKDPKPLIFYTTLGLRTKSLQRGEGPRKTKFHIGVSYLINRLSILGVGWQSSFCRWENVDFQIHVLLTFSKQSWAYQDFPISFKKCWDSSNLRLEMHWPAHMHFI